MTPAEIKKTRLYRTLAPCVRKEDWEELARMLAMVNPADHMSGFAGEYLRCAFLWRSTPQGRDYWLELSRRLKAAGHECW
jgi:hypothetical protein